jgi:hypothetical protein
MRMGQMVYFKDNGIVKQGFVSKEIGSDDVLIICEDISYQRHHWEIAKVPDKKEQT